MNTSGVEGKTACVALTKGDDRYSNIAHALELLADQIDLRGKEHILIKPNFVTIDNALATTHVDAVRAVLDFLRARTTARITIGEGAALGDTFDGYRRFGYTGLVKDYNVELIDLNRGEWIEAPVYNAGFQPMHLRLSRTVVESDLRISVGPPKTHDTVLVTLSLKNMVMGSLIRDQREQAGVGPVMQLAKHMADIVPRAIKDAPLVRTTIVRRMIRSDKSAMHMGNPIINLNLYRLASYVYPHLAVIDGFVGMEGAGPAHGDPVDLRCAIASTDFLAADAVATALMGFDLDEVGYLHYCKLKGLGVADLQRINIVGKTLAECRHPFRPPPTINAQRKWQIADVERLL